jgi:FAD:protein FMN transferase
MAAHQAACHAMATRFEFILHGSDPALLVSAAEEAIAEIHNLEARWSAFRPDSLVSHLNRHAATQTVRVEPDLFKLLVAVRQWWSDTAGAFDPTIGNLLRCWGLRDGKLSGPSIQDLTNALQNTGMQHLALDEATRSVRYLTPGLALDLGAVGKGWAVDAAITLLVEAGVEAALVHAGTSTVKAFGRPPDDEPWVVGIPVPEPTPTGWKAAPRTLRTRSANILARVPITDEALSLSAVWGRAGAHHPGTATSHILDPRTGLPVTAGILAAVIRPSAAEADALSTALLVGGPDLQTQLTARDPTLPSLVAITSDTHPGWRMVPTPGLELRWQDPQARLSGTPTDGDGSTKA